MLPELTICKPMSDLCWVCMKNSTAIIRSANKSETEKSEVKINKLVILLHLPSLRHLKQLKNTFSELHKRDLSILMPSRKASDGSGRHSLTTVVNLPPLHYSLISTSQSTTADIYPLILPKTSHIHISHSNQDLCTFYVHKKFTCLGSAVKQYPDR